MEKISGILPSSSRITAVDLKSSGSVRSGTPNYGRPVGLSSVAEREMQETAARAKMAHDKLMADRSSQIQSQVVQKIADDFFLRKNEPTIAEEVFAEDMDRPQVGGYLDVEA